MKTSNHLEKLFPNTRGGGRGYESKELLRVGAGESSAPTTTDTNTSFATSSTTKQTVAEIWGLKTCGKSHSRFLFFFFMENPEISDLLLGSWQFSRLIFHDCHLKFSEQKQKLNYFEPFQSHPKGI